MTLILLTHIPKTGGTSIKKSSFYRNIKGEDIYRYKGLKRFLQDDLSSFRFIDGHYPYGLHYFTKRRCEYFVSLRNPIDHAVSMYYFIRQCNYPDYKHPRLNEVLNSTFSEFWKSPKNHNPQTKAIAGMLYSKMSNLMPESVYRRACLNLQNRYTGFGLLEESEDFSSRICQHFGWDNKYVKDLDKRTRDRPDADHLSEVERHVLQNSLRYDIRLYEVAKQILLSRKNASV